MEGVAQLVDTINPQLKQASRSIYLLIVRPVLEIWRKSSTIWKITVVVLFRRFHAETSSRQSEDT